VDDCSNTLSSVVVGVDNQLHDGRVYSHRAGYCHYHRDSRLHSGTTKVVKWSCCRTKAKGRAPYERIDNVGTIYFDKIQVVTISEAK
jgi:hypothetical protein